MTGSTDQGGGAPPQPRSRAALDRTTLLHLIILSAAAFALYARTLWNGFVADDDFEVLRDPLIRSFASIPTIFGRSVWFFVRGKAENYYRPLKLLAYSVEYHLFGFHPAYWHLANILFNLAVAIAIYFLVRDLASRTLAFWTALFFAFHPIHVEAVAWIAAGNDLLCGLMLLLALWLYYRARIPAATAIPDPEAANATRPLLLYSASTLLFFAGLLFKETALVFPLILFAFDFIYRRESLREMLRGLLRYAPYFAALGVYLLLRFRALHGFAPFRVATPVTTKELVLTVPVVVCRYLRKAFVPTSLNYQYLYGLVHTVGWRSLAAIALIVVLIVTMFWMRRGKQSQRGTGPLLAFALAWFLLFLVPVLDLRLVSVYFADRYLYIPSFGFCIFAAWVWLQLLDVAWRPWARRLAYTGLLAVFGFYSFVVVRRLPYWHDDLRLFLRTNQQSPNSPMVLGELGFAYYLAGNIQDSLRYSERAVGLDPTLGFAHSNLGAAFLTLRRHDDAMREFQRAVEVEPQFAVFWTNLCSGYNVGKQWQKAVDACRRSLALLPDDRATLTQLGLALWNDGQHDQAIATYRRAIQLDPGRLEARFYLGISLADAGQYDAAVEQLVAGLRTDPRSDIAHLAHYELGAIYQIKGRWADAAEQYKQALESNPNFAPARTQLEAVRSHLPKAQP